MRIVIFCHSLISDWNHGNAHFLRGVTSELMRRRYDVRVLEPRDAWSVQNLFEEEGDAALHTYRTHYPLLHSERYDLAALDVEQVVDGADLVLVHEWNSPDLVRRIGLARAHGGRFSLFFHDTHHRSVSDEDGMAAYDLEHYDGVLAFGDVIRERYLARGWAHRAWTWHEAADPHVFHPMPSHKAGDIVWIGNWGDEERSEELRQFLIGPARDLRLRGCVHGVRYPADACRELSEAGLDYRGWLPNYRAPEVFAQFRVTVHVPRRPYVEALRGIPTIRVFEALACGIPLISCRWDDCEGLFTVGRDFLMVESAPQMRRALRDVLEEPQLAAWLSEQGRRTILARHTCAHRVDELLAIHRSLQAPPVAVNLNVGAV